MSRTGCPGHHGRRNKQAQALPEPGDEQEGGFSRTALLKMHERFVERVERAFKNGGEHRESAAMNGANASRPR
jgi:hypothetical protein